MGLETLITLSCILTSITMLIFSAALFVLIQFGSRGIQAAFNRLLGRGDDNEKETPKQTGTPATAQSQSISSGDALRQRAKQLDFAPAPQAFNAQSAPQQASFTRRDPLAAPPQNPQYTQPQQAQFGQVSPTMPSLSSSRPYQAGQPSFGGQTQSSQTQYGQPQQPLGGQSQYGQPQQPLGGQSQYGQPQQPLGGQRQQYGQPQQPLGGQPQYSQPQQPLGGQGQYGQPQSGQPRQPLGQQFRQPPPIGGQGQYGQPQGNFQQQQQNALRPLGGQDPQQQGTLGQYNPPLQARPNFDQNTNQSPGLRRNRDTRRNERNEIVDDEGGISGIIGEIGDYLP